MPRDNILFLGQKKPRVDKQQQLIRDVRCFKLNNFFPKLSSSIKSDLPEKCDRFHTFKKWVFFFFFLQQGPGFNVPQIHQAHIICT